MVVIDRGQGINTLGFYYIHKLTKKAIKDRDLYNKINNQYEK